MVEVLHAERIKLARHRAAWMMVWIFPIGLLVLGVLATAYEMVRPGPLQPEPSAAAWVRDTASVWEAPRSAVGRYLIAAFTAVAFGGEYGWNTWKLVAPHRNRTALIAAKYLVVLGMLAASFLLLAALYIVVALANDALTKEATPAGVEFGALLAAHGPQALRTTVTTLLTVGYASAAAVLTRSTMAGAVIGIVAISIEAAGRLLLGINPTIYRWTPSHHLANLESWIETGRPLTIPITNPPIADGWAVSAIYLAILIGGLAALTIAAFRRQDLN